MLECVEHPTDAPVTDLSSASLGRRARSGRLVPVENRLAYPTGRAVAPAVVVAGISNRTHV
jgi:hypothetical protein